MPISINPAAMLKPHAPVGMARTMRHLSVPSKETSLWRDRLASEGWLAEGCGIHNLGEQRAIPINENAPVNFENLEIIELNAIRAGPKHWTERLPSELFQKYKSDWPMSHDQIGDVIILKIPQNLQKHTTAIGSALLEQHSSARVVCADNGVKGQFRVRDLSIISSRNSNQTLTKVRESGHEFWVDPGTAYYSPRLANERLATVECAQKLSETLGRKITVCDPYAGVGPALVPLAASDAVSDIYGSDLNPDAAELLAKNIPGHWSACRDARTLSQEISEFCDLLLVNLPHDSIDHLPDIIPLLRKGNEVVIRGWAILPLESLEDKKEEIRTILTDCNIISLTVDANRSYSPSDTYACIEIHLIR